MSYEELAEKARIAQQAGAQVEIVGSWVWAEFDRRPAFSMRQTLLQAGYHWNAKRQVWQFAGTPCRHSSASRPEIEAKYGVKVLEEVVV